MRALTGAQIIDLGGGDSLAICHRVTVAGKCFRICSLTCQLRVKGPLTTGCLVYVRYDNAANVVNKFSVPGDISLARKVRRKTPLNNAAQLSE